MSDAAGELRGGVARAVAENHRFVFSLIHKFNQDVNPRASLTARGTTSL